jgi:O-methyltransferase involved in polyketide biosynthesis
MYLPADAQDRLFGQLTELSVPGSRIAVETVARNAVDRRKEMQDCMRRVSVQLGIAQIVDVKDLMYNDPDRADVAEWLDAHGWRSYSVASDEQQRHLGRWVEVPMADDQDAFGQFVTAERG